MFYAITRDGHPGPVSGVFIDTRGIQHPASVLRLWSEAELATIGVYPIIETSVPEGHRSTGSALHWDAEAKTVTRVHATEPVPAGDLAAIKRSLKSDIDAQAETERARYITPGSGQAMTYQAKAAEAIRYHEASGAGEYPLLSAEIGVTGATLGDVAATVIAMHNQWLLMGAQIERARLSAKAAIEAAEDEATARTVQPDWPAP